MGTIRKLSSATKGTRFKAEVTIDGVRKFKTKNTRREAKQWINDTELAAQRQQQNANYAITFGDAVSNHMDEKLSRYKGRKQDKLRCEKLLDDPISDIRLMDIEYIHGEELMQRMSDAGLAPATVGREIAIAKSILKQCMKRFNMAYPWDGLPSPKIPSARERTTTDAEIDAMCTAVDYDPTRQPETSQQRVIAMWLFAIETAMRQEELSKLRPCDLDLVNSTATLYTTKNDSKRVVPLSPQAMRIIATLPDAGPSQPIFGGMKPNTVSKTFANIRDKADLPHSNEGVFRFHDARRLACTRIARIQGMTPMELCQISGHKNLQEIMTYFNEQPDRMAQRMAQHEKLQQLVKDGSKDQIVETLKLLDISPEELLSRLTSANVKELVDA